MAPGGGDGEAMVDRGQFGDRSAPAYDVQLGCKVPTSVEAQHRFARTRTTRTQTALVGQVRQPEQLDTLLAEVFSVGLVLHDVICLTRPDGDGVATYEVRVEGEIGEALLSHLRWRHRVVPEQTLVRVVAGPADLLQCLKEYTDAGVIIEGVRRVFPVRRADCA